MLPIELQENKTRFIKNPSTYAEIEVIANELENVNYSNAITRDFEFKNTIHIFINSNDHLTQAIRKKLSRDALGMTSSQTITPPIPNTSHPISLHVFSS